MKYLRAFLSVASVLVVPYLSASGAEKTQHTVINRGFGGSQIVDATHFAPRIIFPYAPKAIYLRSGGNDL
jgi:hypothetical protein